MIIRISLVAAAALASAAPATSLAQTQAKPAKEAPKPLTKTDFTKSLDSRFHALDANHDNVLTKDEIAATQQRAMQNAQNATKQKLEGEFKKLDTNKDGQLSQAEFLAAAPPVRASETPDQMLAQLDGNKDGKVSLLEYRAIPVGNFEKMDTNKDGTLTPQEVAAARKK